MKNPLIIQLATARKPLTWLRDTFLLVTCWLMWMVVLVAAFNSAEWDLLERASGSWLHAQEVFITALLHSFHVSSGYFGMVAVLMIGFGLWSVLNRALAPRRHEVESHPLGLATLAQHFHLDGMLIACMQRQKTVIVQHAADGTVTAIAAAPTHTLQTTDQLLLAA